LIPDILGGLVRALDDRRVADIGALTGTRAADWAARA
jgi:hypothetical protein